MRNSLALALLPALSLLFFGTAALAQFAAPAVDESVTAEGPLAGGNPPPAAAMPEPPPPAAEPVEEIPAVPAADGLPPAAAEALTPEPLPIASPEAAPVTPALLSEGGPEGMPEGVMDPAVPASLPESIDAPNRGDISLNGASSRWNLSLMFSTADRRTIQKALDFLSRDQPKEATVAQPNEAERFNRLLDDIISAVDPKKAAAAVITPKPRLKEIPAFHLQSILYKSPEEWAVWINGRKYSPWEKPSGFSISRVDARSVTLRWQSNMLDQVAPGWQRRKGRSPQVTIQRDSGTVIVRLLPNQSFAGRVLDVVEGRVLPQKVYQKEEASPETAAPATEASPSDPANPDIAQEPPPGTPGIFNSIFGKEAPKDADRENSERMRGMYDHFQKLRPAQ